MTAADRQRWLVKLLQHAAEEAQLPPTWRELVTAACEYGATAEQPPRPWEFDALRTVTVAALYEMRDDPREYLSPPAVKEP